MKLFPLAALALLIGGCASTQRNLDDDYDTSRAISVDAPRSAAETVEAVDPALWQVADADTTIYLLGTFHLLPEEYEWRTPEIDAAIAASDTLVLETIIDPANPAELGQLMAELGLSRDLPPLVERVEPRLRPTLEAMVLRSGIPMQSFDVMENWAAALTLMSVHTQTLGLSPEAGVEADLRAAFTAAGKPLDQLETNAQQLGFFDGLSLDAQRELLESMLVSTDEIKGSFGDMLAAWTRGDVDAIAATFNEDMPLGSEQRSVILTQRNRNWATWIDNRLDAPGTVLVAVGAGHLAGDDSLILMLQAAGFTVTRLD